MTYIGNTCSIYSSIETEVIKDVSGIIRNDEFILPMADDVIMSNDIIILVGKNKDVTKFERFINS